MTNWNRAERSACECLLDLANVIRHGRCVGSHAGEVADTYRRFTVKVFAADRDSCRDLGQARAIFRDGGLKSGELTVEAGLTTRGPNAQEE